METHCGTSRGDAQCRSQLRGAGHTALYQLHRLKYVRLGAHVGSVAPSELLHQFLRVGVLLPCRRQLSPCAS